MYHIAYLDNTYHGRMLCDGAVSSSRFKRCSIVKNEDSRESMSQSHVLQCDCDARRVIVLLRATRIVGQVVTENQCFDASDAARQLGGSLGGALDTT